jgi:hypothetical protein
MSHSAFIIFNIISSQRFLPFDIISYSAFIVLDIISSRRFFTFRRILPSFLCPFVVILPFDVLSFRCFFYNSMFFPSTFCLIQRFVHWRFLPSAFFTLTFCQWIGGGGIFKNIHPCISPTSFDHLPCHENVLETRSPVQHLREEAN